MPEAELIYLAARLILPVAEAGFDLIAACHAAGKPVDAYTLNGTTPDDIAMARALIALHADQITCDDPEGMAAALSRA